MDTKQITTLDGELAEIRERARQAQRDEAAAYRSVDDVPRLLAIIERLRAEVAAYEQDGLGRHGWQNWDRDPRPDRPER